MTTTHSKFGYSRRATASSVALSMSGGSRWDGMWIDTLGAKPSGAGAAAAISRRGARPNAIEAISSTRASAINTSGISSTMPSPSAKPAPATK